MTYDPQNVFARILRRELPCEQVFEDAHTLTVPHVHFHVIPRRPGELLRLHATVKADPAHLRANAERIRRCLTEN